MKKIALIVEYEGSLYKGFQNQKNEPTIQNKIENALSMLTTENIEIKAAGRTDAGVHAKSQVISFNTMTQNPIQTYITGTNHFLPDDISIKNACEVDIDFDPRRMAISRKYQYSIDCGTTRSPLTAKFAYYLGKALNVPMMIKGSKYFLGIHDFKNFSVSKRNESKSTIREIYNININKIEKMVYITVEGSAFLSHQVRRMCGALVSAGTEVIKPNIIKDMLENNKPANDYVYAIIKRDEDSLIGGTNITTKGEIGCWIGKNYWKKGFATETVERMAKFGFETLKLEKVWAATHEENKAPMKVLEKVGFSRVDDRPYYVEGVGDTKIRPHFELTK